MSAYSRREMVDASRRLSSAARLCTRMAATVSMSESITLRASCDLQAGYFGGAEDDEVLAVIARGAADSEPLADLLVVEAYLDFRDRLVAVAHALEQAHADQPGVLP